MTLKNRYRNRVRGKISENWTPRPDGKLSWKQQLGIFILFIIFHLIIGTGSDTSTETAMIIPTLPLLRQQASYFKSQKS